MFLFFNMMAPDKTKKERPVILPEKKNKKCIIIKSIAPSFHSKSKSPSFFLSPYTFVGNF